MTKKGNLTRKQYARLYMRCKTRGIDKGYRGEDLTRFIKSCIEEQIDKGLIGRLTHEEKLKKLVKTLEQREKEVVYVRVPSREEQTELETVLRDLFVDQNRKSKRQQLDDFLDSHDGKVDYRTLMRKIEEIENE